jgi:hypothetical protein
MIRTRCGRQAAMQGECGARARTCNPLPGGFGSSTRPALRPVCEKHRWTVAGRFAGNTRLKAPAQEARNWSRVVAFGRLSQNRGGTPIDVRLPLAGAAVPVGTANYRCVCRRFASDIFFRSFRTSLPDLIRQSMRNRGSHSASTGAQARRFSMDHRVKPGGDESETVAWHNSGAQPRCENEILF